MATWMEWFNCPLYCKLWWWWWCVMDKILFYQLWSLQCVSVHYMEYFRSVMYFQFWCQKILICFQIQKQRIFTPMHICPSALITISDPAFVSLFLIFLCNRLLFLTSFCLGFAFLQIRPERVIRGGEVGLDKNVSVYSKHHQRTTSPD